MKAVILAAGMGTRLGKYTDQRPKGMLLFNGRSLIADQLDVYKKCGITDISIATGYMADKITFPDVKYYHNPNYAETNMVESLMAARMELDDAVLVSYADIIFEPDVIETIKKSDADFSVTVDMEWQDYWTARYDRPDYDLESLEIDSDGYIKQIGSPDPPIEKIDGRYVGLLKFSKKGVDILKSVYDDCRSRFWNKPWHSSKLFNKAYMTDILTELINRGYPVQASQIRHGWLEFDTNQDYERSLDWLASGRMEKFIRL